MVFGEDLSALVITNEKFPGAVVGLNEFCRNQESKSGKTSRYSRSIASCHQAYRHGMNSIGRDDQVRRMA